MALKLNKIIMNFQSVASNRRQQNQAGIFYLFIISLIKSSQLFFVNLIIGSINNYTQLLFFL